MKLWLCILSALLLAGCTAGTDVPGSVTPTAVPTPAATETGETAEAAATPAPTADAVQPPQGLVETGAAVLDTMIYGSSAILGNCSPTPRSNTTRCARTASGA